MPKKGGFGSTEENMEDKQELVDNFEKLMPANKANALSLMRMALEVQENTLNEARERAEKAEGSPAA